MSPPVNSSRYRLKVLARMKRAFTKYPDGFPEGVKDDSNDIIQMWNDYEGDPEISDDNKDLLYDEIAEFIVRFCQSRYADMLAAGIKTIQEIRSNLMYCRVRSALTDLGTPRVQPHANSGNR